MSDVLYSIKESTLTDIGDALRRKHGETEWVTITEELPVTIVSKTANATGYDSWEGLLETGTRCKVISIPNAKSIVVKLSVNFGYYGGNSLHVKILSGTYTVDEAIQANATIYGNKTLTNYDLEFEDTSIITILYYNAGFNPNTLGYYAEIFGLDENKEFISAPTEVEKEVKKTYSSSEMADAIDDIEVGGLREDFVPDEALVISGSCQYKFVYNSWNWFIEKYGDLITTNDITNANMMFYQSDELKRIPFKINFSNNDGLSLQSFFNYCSDLMEVPIVNIPNANKINMSSIFDGCRQIRDFNGFFDNEDEFIESFQNYKNTSSFGELQVSSIMSNCYSLRKVPTWFNKLKLNPESTVYPYQGYCLYNCAFQSCHALDEVKNIPVWKCKGAATSNMFSNTFISSGRLKDITFETNEDGTPIVTEWKSQTIDLTYVGYVNGSEYIIRYNSGITADKQVKDDAFYQTLKDDEDWWTVNVAYSRYNKTSAVNTINSLPDTSAYLATAGGTNTIKFKGTMGEKTDGGAINTLTAEEIAVATAKGWTVTLA